MKDERLSGLTAFVQVVRSGGFRSAAAELNMSAASVSEAVRRLENRIGVQLLQRTTRSVSVTEAGQAFYERCGDALDRISDAIDDVQGSQSQVSGTLRLTAPWVAGPMFLNELATRFLQTYPHAKLELNYDDRKLDFVSSGMDAAIRSSGLVEQDAQAIPVGPALPMVVVGSPDYLDRMGIPSSPQDLKEYDGIFFRLSASNAIAPWVFTAHDEQYTVQPRQRCIVNDAQTALEMAAQGLGLTYTYLAYAQEPIDQGQLVALFSDSAAIRPRFSISFIKKKHMPAKLQAFIDLSQIADLEKS